MRTGISITLKPSDRRRLAALARDRNAPHKHVWRAEIVLLSANGVGTHEIMRRTGKSKTCVWRWQLRRPQASESAAMARPTPALPLPLHADLLLVAQRRRGLLRQTRETATKARCLSMRCRSPSHDQPLRRRDQP